MASESPKQSKSGVAYDVILAPATNTEGTPRPSSPPKERPLSQEIIAKKLDEAEKRRLSLEAAKLKPVEKQKERAQEAVKRVEELNDSFSKVTEKKLVERLESMEEKKDKQMKALQERLKDHAKRVEAARKQSELYTTQLKERVALESNTRLTAVKEKRDAIFKAMQERLQEHEKHVQEVVESCSKLKEQVSKCTEEKMIRRMNTTLQNREDQLKQILVKLQDHERHVEEVRSKKETLAAGGDSVVASS